MLPGWTAADALYSAAHAVGSPELRRAADIYDQAACVGHGRILGVTSESNQLRAMARRMASGRSDHQRRHSNSQ
jgi:hypothetical protein